MKPTFDRLMQAAAEVKPAGRKTPSAVARLIDESEQTISNWKHRGVPKAKHLDISRKLGCNPEWFATGNGDMNGHAAFQPAARQIGEQAPAPYAHRHPTIQQIISMLEATDDIGLGVALMAVSEALERHRPSKRKGRVIYVTDWRKRIVRTNNYLEY